MFLMSYGQFPLCWVAAVKVTERSHRLGLWRFLESLMLESLTRLREIKLNYLIHVVHKALTFYTCTPGSFRSWLFTRACTTTTFSCERQVELP